MREWRQRGHYSGGVEPCMRQGNSMMKTVWKNHRKMLPINARDQCFYNRVTLSTCVTSVVFNFIRNEEWSWETGCLPPVKLFF